MDNQQIGEFISYHRKKLYLTQQDLADQLNVTNKAVSKWETGNGLPDISILTQLALCLDVSTDELLQGKTEDKIKAISNIPEIDKESNHTTLNDTTVKKKILLHKIATFSYFFLLGTTLFTPFISKIILPVIMVLQIVCCIRYLYIHSKSNTKMPYEKIRTISYFIFPIIINFIWMLILPNAANIPNIHLIFLALISLTFNLYLLLITLFLWFSINNRKR